MRILSHMTVLLVCRLVGAVAANLISPKPFGHLTDFWTQYGYGLTDRGDVFAAYGDMTVLGETQHYVAIGTMSALDQILGCFCGRAVVSSMEGRYVL